MRFYVCHLQSRPETGLPGIADIYEARFKEDRAGRREASDSPLDVSKRIFAEVWKPGQASEYGHSGFKRCLSSKTIASQTRQRESLSGVERA